MGAIAAAAMSKNADDYVVGHAALADAELLALSGVLTPPVMFVATFEAKLTNLSMPMADAIVMVDAAYPIIVINSNFGHKCVPGYEAHLKLKPKKTPGARKGQGDRTCFNSALEPIIVLDRPDIRADKVYKMKCFPSTGEVQVPGTLKEDMSDAVAAVEAWAALLNYHGLGDADAAGDPSPIAVESSRPNMINFKFRIVRASPRILIDLYCMADYFVALEEHKVVAGRALTEREQDAALDAVPHGTALVVPPFAVRETKPPIEDVKLTFKFGRVRVKIFQRGKVNILGADSFEAAHAIHAYLADLLEANRAKFIRVQPRSDAERKRQDAPALARRRRDLTEPHRAAVVAPVFLLSDADVCGLLADLMLDGPASPAGTNATAALDDAAVDEVHRQDEEDDEEDALQGHAP